MAALFRSRNSHLGNGDTATSMSGVAVAEPANAPPALECRGISKRFGAVQAIADLDLTVPVGKVVALLGPSGCGKTTALRLVAGFDHPDTGTISIGGRRVYGDGAAAPPEKRRVGMVFQEGALFPHLTVEQNIAYGLGRNGGREDRISEVLRLVGLEDLRHRMPHELSGGQQQRVALARALAPGPDLLLLDEPFASLDPGLRSQVRQDTLEILRASGATAIFVTHDQEEALLIGDTIVVMNEGRIEQVDTPEGIFHTPDSRFVAEFIGTADFIPARQEGSQVVTEVGSVDMADLPGAASRNGAGSPDYLEVMVRPDCLDCYPSPEGQGAITGREFRGPFYIYRVSLPSGATVRCLLSHTREYPVGTPVQVTLRNGHSLRPFVAGRAVT